jgi:hypothetical protein
MIKLWLVERTDTFSYDDYDSMVVAADTESEACTYHPNGLVKAYRENQNWQYLCLGNTHVKPYWSGSWCAIEDTRVSYLGTTDRDIKGVILASFNAG